MAKPAMKHATLALLLALSGSPALARDAASYIGYADTSCATWTDARAKARANSYSLEGLTIERGMRQWALGVVSGANWANREKDILQGIDAEAISGWIDQRCLQNPLDNFAHTVFDLAQELVHRAEQTGRQPPWPLGR